MASTRISGLANDQGLADRPALADTPPRADRQGVADRKELADPSKLATERLGTKRGLAQPSVPERPGAPVVSSTDLGGLLGAIRRGLGIRQADLAAHARVSRQWVVALEQGKPTLELGLVLRTIEALGLEVDLKPYAPPPAWVLDAMRAGTAAQAEAQTRHRQRRRTSRESARLNRLAENARTVWPDLG